MAWRLCSHVLLFNCLVLTVVGLVAERRATVKDLNVATAPVKVDAVPKSTEPEAPTDVFSKHLDQAEEILTNGLTANQAMNFTETTIHPCHMWSACPCVHIAHTLDKQDFDTCVNNYKASRYLEPNNHCMLAQEYKDCLMGTLAKRCGPLLSALICIDCIPMYAEILECSSLKC